MKRFVHLGFRFQRPPNYRELEEAISAMSEDWIRYSSDNWVLWTPVSVVHIYQGLAPHMTQVDHVLIAGLDEKDVVGFLPPWMWTWMHSKNPESGVVFGEEIRQAVLTQKDT